jgi:hypothetical protein
MKLKHLKHSFFVSLIAAPVLFAGCQSGPPSVVSGKDAGAAGIIAYKVERDIPLSGDDPVSKMRISLRIPDAGREEGDPLKQLIWKLFYAGQRPEQYAAELLAVSRQQYEGVKGMVDKDPDYPRASLNWFYTEDFSIPLVNPFLIVMKRDIEFYTGGAHGMRLLHWYVIDREKTEQLRLGALFAEAGKTGLERALQDGLRKQAGAEANDKLSGAGYFEDFVPVPDNFFLSPQGVGFHWNPAEIAPYSFGFIELILPYGEIRSLLSPRGLELIASLWGQNRGG